MLNGGQSHEAPLLNLLRPTKCDAIVSAHSGRDEDVNIRSDATLKVMFHGNRFAAVKELVQGFEAENPGERLSWTSLPPKNTINAIKSVGRDPEISSVAFLPDVVLGPQALQNAILPLRDDGVQVVNVGRYSSVTGVVAIARSSDDRVRTAGDRLSSSLIAGTSLRVVLPGFQERTQVFIRTFDTLLGPGGLDQLAATGRVDVGGVRHHRDIPSRIRSGCGDIGIQFLQSKVYWEMQSPGVFQFLDVQSQRKDLEQEDSYVFIVKPNSASTPTVSPIRAMSVDAFVGYMFSRSALTILRKYGLQPSGIEH